MTAIREGIFTPPCIILALVLILAFPSSVIPQTIVLNPSQVAPVDQLTVNDLDFLNATTPKWLFTISMQSDGPVDAIMTIAIDAMLPGMNFPAAVNMTTESFTVNGVRNITNIDLTNDNPVVVEHTVDQAAKSRLEETALPGGKIPAGIYRFNVTVTPTGGQGVSTTFTLEPTNPSSVQLLFPPNEDDAVSELTLFQWRYDGPRSRLSIYERLPGQSSLEETISGVPHLTQEVETNSFQYPSSGARLLQPGKSYAWVVEGLSGVSGGTEAVLRSEIRSFRVSTQGAGGISEILAMLESALGPSHKGTFDRIRDEGLEANGTISINGSPVNESDIIRLIDLFRQNPGAVNIVELE